MTYVYFRKIHSPLTETVFPKERDEEIKSSPKKIGVQKYAVWKLLLYAIENQYGVKAEEVGFRKNPFGKWECDLCEFSLSHTSGGVAVAVSDKKVGIDVERSDRFNGKDNGFLERFAAKITSGQEEFPVTKKDALKLWTAKESVFKAYGNPSFTSFRAIDYGVKTFEKDGYVISVCTEDESFVFL